MFSSQVPSKRKVARVFHVAGEMKAKQALKRPPLSQSSHADLIL